MWNISQGNHDEILCKENCEENGALFNHIPYHCKFSLAHQEIPSDQIRPLMTGVSPTTKIKALLQEKSSKIVMTSTHPRLWNRSNIEDQELVKFDLIAAQFKAMEIEVQKGGRTMEDLKQLKIELDKM